jgi:hypothetical protein
LPSNIAGAESQYNQLPELAADLGYGSAPSLRDLAEFPQGLLTDPMIADIEKELGVSP